MRVSKWGNSLAVRIPAEMVEELGLKEGDEATFNRTGPNIIEVETPMSFKDRLKWLRANGPLFPADYKFDRAKHYEEEGR
jgi:antitoxin MazE